MGTTATCCATGSGGDDVTIEKPNEGVAIIAISDPGQDLDDEMSYMLMRHLIHLGLVDIKGIICTLNPAFDRARLARGTLDTLGLYNIPVGVGTDGGDLKGVHLASTFEGWAEGYMPAQGSERCFHLEPGRLLLTRLLQDAQPNSVTILIIAALKDPAVFLRDNPALFQQKVKDVVIMGGVQPWEEGVLKPKGPVLQPDTAHNQEFDRASSEFLFTRCQELGIPVIVVSRWAAYAAKVPRNCYDELAAMGSSIGCRLRNAQRDSIESLWARAARAADDPLRKGLPARCDSKWFTNSFCGGNADAASRGPDDTIWDLIVGFMQYDSVALLCCVPELRQRFFKPCIVMGPKDTTHMVIGKSEEEHGILDIPALTEYLDTGFRLGLSRNNMYRPQFILLAQPLWNNIADELLSMAMLRVLYSLGIINCIGIVVCTCGPGNPGQQIAPDSCEDIKKTLHMLGLANIPVYVHPYASDECVEGLHQLYKKVGPAGASLVVTGCLGTVVEFTKAYPKMFREKTQIVVHIGGANIVKVESAGMEAKSWLEADPNAASNKLDLESAEEFYQMMQQSLLVPIMVISSHCIKACKVPMSLFDKLATHGGEVGKELHKYQKTAVESLWKAACATNPDQRFSLCGGLALPGECNREWFIKTFCGGNAPKTDDDIWSVHGPFHVYTSLAILATLKAVRTIALAPTEVMGRTVKHIVVGTSDKDNGVTNSNLMRSLLYQCFFKGLLLNCSEFNQSGEACIELDGNVEPWIFDSSELALEWLRL